MVLQENEKTNTAKKNENRFTKVVGIALSIFPFVQISLRQIHQEPNLQILCLRLGRKVLTCPQSKHKRQLNIRHCAKRLEGYPLHRPVLCY